MSIEQTGVSRKKIYFEHLDGLRFFCFLAVFFFHSFHTENPSIEENSLFATVKHHVFGNGFLGVNFFFVLSGFLITYLLIEERRLKGKINILNFWLRRILRIWPLYFACVFIGFVVFPLAKSMAGGIPVESANPWYYIGFINNFDYIAKGLPDAPGLGVLWSIAIEEQFYLVWPLVLSVFPIKKYWIPFVIIIAGSLVYRAFHDVHILHEMHTLSCIGDMAIGAMGAWLLLERPQFFKAIEQLPRAVIVSAYILFFMIFLFRDELMLDNYYMRIFERAVLAVTILVIIMEQCFSENSFYKMGNFKAVSRLGLITYSLYCIHFMVISATYGVINKTGMNQQVWQVLLIPTLISFIITFVVSRFSYKYFESPFLKLKDKFSYITKK
jgi:peptidoglycan/LPS O-acetylase OafA/YrhL